MPPLTCSLVRVIIACSLALVACSSDEARPDAPPATPIDGNVGGAFGEKCTCAGGGANGSKFECFGTNICSSGLSCVGQTFGGISEGTCRGPVCCNSKTECATVLGKRGSCEADQKCVCTFGDLECVGTACTCAGGVSATRGLCYPN
jgi:hypothetical protein